MTKKLPQTRKSLNHLTVFRDLIVEPDHRISYAKRLLIEMDILNEKDLDIAAINESHKNIEKEELKK